MKDVGGNIRYYGASPNNYIYFNCTDYSNQSSSTCETWRIIGVFDDKLKLIRNSSIGKYSWDNKNKTTGAEADEGKNDWTDARLMKLLNPGYESEANGGSLYYNSKSGNCYAGQNNATKTCDFTNTGIKNEATRNLISTVTYYLGGWDGADAYSNQLYEYERGTTVYTGRPTTWQGKMALAYPNDYGYATDLEKCTKKIGVTDSTCKSNNWINTITKSAYNWLLPSMSDDSLSVTYFDATSNFIGSIDGYFSFDVEPVLYLIPELSIKTGSGSSSSPYQLSI